MQKKFLVVGVSLITLGIILGAFGAHALKAVLSEEKLISFETGVRYQMYMGISFILFGIKSFNFEMKAVFRLWLMGVLFFSGSIYFLSIQDLLNVKLSFLGPITPLGGTFLIAGWIWLLSSIVRKS